MKTWIKKLFARAGFRLERIPPPAPVAPVAAFPYDRDGLRTVHNADFLETPEFKKAYARGVQAAGRDYDWPWRVHVGLWAARVGARLAGDFVECGVNRGFLSSAIMADHNWDCTGKTFYLLDTFEGIDARYVTEKERQSGILESSRKNLSEGFYIQGVDIVRENFSEWKNLQIVVGAVPETLPEIKAPTIAFLHLDMNCAPPEIAALEYCWPRLAAGAPVLLDDYAYNGHGEQKRLMDEAAERLGTTILSLPTGQGLLIKPPLA